MVCALDRLVPTPANVTGWPGATAASEVVRRSGRRRLALAGHFVRRDALGQLRDLECAAARAVGATDDEAAVVRFQESLRLHE